MKPQPVALAVQHVAVEPPNAIASALAAAGFRLDVVRIDRGEEPPRSADGLAALVVMGGPMGVYEAERFPHLSAEIRLLESALRGDVPILGVCLGSQLLAAALGAAVAPAGFQEIGWFPVALEPGTRGDPLLGGSPPRFTALHWHGDAFELPRGAVPLARSERTPLQAFRHGRAFGLLFHAEVDGPQVAAMSRAFERELARAGTSAAALAEGARLHGEALRDVGLGIFGRFARLASER